MVEAFGILLEHLFVYLEAQAGACEGGQHGVFIGDDGRDDAFAELRHPGRLLQRVFQRVGIAPVGQHHIPVDVESDAVGPGMGRILAVMLVAGIDDLFDLGYTPGEHRVRLVNVEAVLLEHDLYLVPAVVKLGA